MIVRKDEYKVDEVAYLLDLPARTVLALCDSGLLACSRLVANGAKQQRKKRYVAHGEVVRFNASQPAGSRSDLAGRLADPDADQPRLPFAAEAEKDDGPVVFTVKEWLATVAAIKALSAKSAILNGIALKIGPAGDRITKLGLRVQSTEEAAA